MYVCAFWFYILFDLIGAFFLTTLKTDQIGDVFV